MRSSKNFHAITGKMVLMLVLSCLLGVSSASAQKKWYFGIGTGLMRLNAEGDQGLNLGQLGPAQVEFDLDPDDFNDLMESAIGFGGYVTNGTLMFQYSFAQLKLGGDPSGVTPDGATVSAEYSYDITTGGLTAGYTVYQGGRLGIQPYVGFRYLKHELGADLTVVGQTTTTVSRAIDHNWTDVLVGTSLNVALSPKVAWSVSADAGFGGSNGTYSIATSVSWRFWQYMSLIPNASFMAIDYENGEIGDSDWYLYDANEFGWGLSFLIHL